MSSRSFQYLVRFILIVLYTTCCFLYHQEQTPRRNHGLTNRRLRFEINDGLTAW